MTILNRKPMGDNSKINTVVCSGAAGAGKTDAVIEVIYSSLDKYSSIFWLEAADKNILQTTYFQLSKNLALTQDNADDIRMLRGWFSKQQNCLIIYNNASDYQDIEPFIPLVGPDILITSRNSKVAPENNNFVRVNFFDKTQAKYCLKAYLGNREIDKEEHIDELAEIAECIPLALAQFAVYIRRHRIDIPRFIEIYKINKIHILSGGNQKLLPPDYNGEVLFHTLDSTLTKIKNRSSFTFLILNIMSWLNEKIVNFEIFDCFSNNFHLNQQRELSQNALGLLENNSIVSYHLETQVIVLPTIFADIIWLKQSLAEKFNCVDFLYRLLSGQQWTLNRAVTVARKDGPTAREYVLVEHLQVLIEKLEKYKELLQAEQNTEIIVNYLYHTLCLLSICYQHSNNNQKKQIVDQRLETMRHEIQAKKQDQRKQKHESHHHQRQPREKHSDERRFHERHPHERHPHEKHYDWRHSHEGNHPQGRHFYGTQHQSNFAIETSQVRHTPSPQPPSISPGDVVSKKVLPQTQPPQVAHSPEVLLRGNNVTNETNVVLQKKLASVEVIKTVDDMKKEKHDYVMKLWNIPQRNLNFVGRAELLSQIASRLQKYSGDQKQPVVITACEGIRGVGKTELVVEYIYRHLEEYFMICWVPAEDESKIEAAFIDLANDLNISRKDAVKEVNIEILKTYFLNHPKCLIILDNAPSYHVIKNYLPVMNTDVLVTSLSADWLDASINVPIFELKEAEEYIEKILGNRNCDSKSEIQNLITKFGRLPLALSLATALIKYNKMTIKNFLELYAHKKSALLSTGSLHPGEHHIAISITWNMAFEEIQRKSALAPIIFIICTYFWGDRIPEILMQAVADSKLQNPQQELLSEALELLCSYSLISIDMTTRNISMHCLIQEVMRLKYPLQLNIANIMYAFKLIHTNYPYGHELKSLSQFQTKKILTPHVETLLKLAENFLTEIENLLQSRRSHMMYSSPGYSNGRTIQQDKPELEKVIIILMKFLDDAYGALGEVLKQKLITERLYPHIMRVESKNDLEIAGVFCNMGIQYGKNYEHQKEKACHEKSLMMIKSIYGKRSPEVAHSLLNLASACYHLEEFSRQEELLLEAQDILNENPTWPKRQNLFLTVIYNLSSCYNQQGKHQVAMGLLNNLRESVKAQYGEKHPEYAKVLSNIAKTTTEMRGNIQEVIALYDDSLNIMKEFYGVNHAGVAEEMSKLAMANLILGYHDKAILLLEQSIIIFQETCGAEHPKVAEAMGNLGKVYMHSWSKKKDLELLIKSKNLQERAVNMLDQYLPAGHIELANGKYNLACVNDSLGNIIAAKQLYVDVLPIYQKYGEKYDFVVKNLSAKLVKIFMKEANALEAIKYYKIRIALAEKESIKDSGLYHNIGCCYHVYGHQLMGAERNKKYDLAKEQFLKGIAITSNLSIVCDFVMLLLDMGQIEPAIVYLINALKNPADETSLFYGKLEWELHDDHIKQEIENCSKKNQDLTISGRYFGYYLLIQCYRRINNPAIKQEELNIQLNQFCALVKKANNLLGFRLISYLYADLGDNKKAQEYAQYANQNTPLLLKETQQHSIFTSSVVTLMSQSDLTGRAISTTTEDTKDETKVNDQSSVNRSPSTRGP